MVNKVTSNRSVRLVQEREKLQSTPCSFPACSEQQIALPVFSTLKRTPAIHRRQCTACSEGVRPMHKEGMATAVVWSVQPDGILLVSLVDLVLFFLMHPSFQLSCPLLMRSTSPPCPLYILREKLIFSTLATTYLNLEMYK
jgi:hypothetical protein